MVDQASAAAAAMQEQAEALSGAASVFKLELDVRPTRHSARKPLPLLAV